MTNSYIERVLQETKKNNPEQPEFIQAVTEVLTSLQAVIDAHPEYESQAILERLIEPERIVIFKVPVEMDDHQEEHSKVSHKCSKAYGREATTMIAQLDMIHDMYLSEMDDE